MRLRSVITCIWPLILGAACGSDGNEPVDDGGGDLGDVEGIEEVAEGLTDLSSQCTFTVGTGLMELELATGDIAMINKAPDARVVINGFACQGATATTLKNLVITGTSGAQTVIIDYMGGTFALGTTGGAGIDVDLSGGTDALKIRGSKAVDNYVFGDGIAINTDNNKDITFANVETFVATLSDGADVFSGAGNTATGATAFTAVLTLYGGAGNDVLRGGDGDDIYFGGDNDDTFLAGPADDGADVMNGGAGIDTIDYSARVAAVVATIEGTANDGVSGELDNVKVDIENLKGGTVGDTLTGSTAANVISGGAGDDTLAGGGDIDTLNGDAGDDTFNEGSATNGADVMNGGAGTDTVSYALRTNPVVVNIDATANDGETGEGDKVVSDVENATGGAGVDTLTGSVSNNVLDGGAAIDTISGGDGNDTIRGGAAADILTGGNGDDTFDEGSASNGADTITGGAGIDLVSYGARIAAVVVVMDATTGSGEASEGDKIGTDVENLRGGAETDTLTGNALDNVLEGGAEVDTIKGLGGDDAIDGDADADIIDCGDGDGDILLDNTVDLVLVPVNCEL
ncbi:MAG TPA: calcium-binding protein [Kofleriaceae bacterium]|nr:calcium-binding protein [Kofleriaceae bacterium]